MFGFIRCLWFKAIGNVETINEGKNEVVLTGRFALEHGLDMVPQESGKYTLIIQGSPANVIKWGAGNKLDKRTIGNKIKFHLTNKK